MASLYRRKDSKYWFLRFRTPGGQWKDKSLGLRINNPIETRKARLIQKSQTVKEAVIVTPSNLARWDKWCLKFISERWAGRTREIYLKHFFKLEQYFREMGVLYPAALSRSDVFQYPEWRQAQGVRKNAALLELKLLRQLLKEAIARNFCDRNEAAGLGIKHEDCREKSVWTDSEIRRANEVLVKDHKFSWIHVTFLFGLFQACRMQQCSIPVNGIDFDRGTISYPSVSVKGGRPFSHRIDPLFRQTLLDLCEFRKGHVLTCDIPVRPSLVWREVLDSLGYRHLCHHGLRVTWITRAALAGVPENISMRFVNHASSTVHKLYQKITVEDQSIFLDRLILPDISA